MSDLTPERRADLRMLLGDLDAHLAMDPRPSTAVPFAALLDAALPALPALLDAADERDRLAAAVERIEHDARCPHPKCPGHGMCCCPEAKP